MLLSSKSQNIPSQCEIATMMLKADCCSKPKDINCSKAVNPNDAIATLGYDHKIGVPTYNPNGHWSRRTDYKGWYQNVVNSIKNGSPVLIRRNEMRRGYRFIISNTVYGTYSKNGKDYLIVMDHESGTTRYWDFSYVTGNLAWITTTTLK
jgi:hypothetical protein